MIPLSSQLIFIFVMILGFLFDYGGVHITK